MPSKTKMKAILKSMIEALEKKDVDRLLKYFTDDASISCFGFEYIGENGIKRWVKWTYSGWTTFTSTEKGMIIEGNKVAKEFTMKVTTTDGLSGSVDGVSIYEFKGDKIQSYKIHYDRLLLAGQTTKGYFRKRVVDSVIRAMEEGARA